MNPLQKEKHLHRQNDTVKRAAYNKVDNISANVESHTLYHHVSDEHYDPEDVLA